MKLDLELLVELGLEGLPSSHRRSILQIIYQELETRVGKSLAGQMTGTQLSHFEVLVNKNDESGALAYIEENFSDYRNVVRNEFQLLKAEISAQVLDIKALSSAYAEIPIDIPPRMDPWKRREDAVDT